MACYEEPASSEDSPRYGCPSPHPCRLFQLWCTSSTYQHYIWRTYLMTDNTRSHLSWNMLVAFAACALEMPPSALHEHRDYSCVADVHPCPSEGTYMCSRVFRICTECFHTGTPIDVLEGRDGPPFLYIPHSDTPLPASNTRASACWLPTGTPHWYHSSHIWPSSVDTPISDFERLF